MRTINFIFAIHLHQPVGNFDGVFKYATEQSYLPLLRELNANPEFRFSIHASGPLWEYWDENCPEIFDLVAEMAERRQVELLGGGFYEPILAVIPRRDAIGQIETMARFLEGKFGEKPRGIWLTERIWEPHLPSILAEAGVEFTIADDYHFKSVGVTGDKLLGHYTTEDSGKTTEVFPVSEELRYLIPFAQADKPIEYLINSADESGESLLVFGDDGEKFGLWPGTNKWVWEEGWMKRFIEGVLANRDVIKLRSFGEWRDSVAPMGSVYLPTISYFEMSEWTLPAELASSFASKVHSLRDSGQLEDWRPFLKGGFWRGFLSKYPESGWMHKRMLRASAKVLESGEPEARKALYRAQCNCAYWHGVFGGLYLPHLRRGVFDNIIRAERHANADFSEAIRIERNDLDCDGYDEVFLGNGEIQVFIKPSDGGKIYEVDIMRCDRNIIDTLSRRQEGYHLKVSESEGFEADGSTSIHDIVHAKEADLGRLLHYDIYNRRWLVDHILADDVTPQAFRNCDFARLGDFFDKPYNIVLGPEITKTGARVVLRRNGNIYKDGVRIPLSIEKTIYFEAENKIRVEYFIKNPNDFGFRMKFGVENNLSLLSRDNPTTHLSIPSNGVRKIRPGEVAEFSGIADYKIVDEYDGFELAVLFDEAELWMFPIETVSNSESGFERVFQETSLLHIWDITLPSLSTARIGMEILLKVI